MAHDIPKSSKREFMTLSTFPSLNPKLEREARELFELAQDVKEESVFLQEPFNKKFNTRYDGGQSFIMCMCRNFQLIGFDNVCIHWCQKFLKNRVCTSLEKDSTLCTLMMSYFSTKNYEKVLECGHEWLSLQKGKTKTILSDKNMSMTLKWMRINIGIRKR